MFISHHMHVPREGGGYDVPYEAVRAALDGQPWSGGTRRALAVLMPADTGWNSASTKHPLHGPATVTWVEYPDGAIDTIVSA
jgi:hypothetical protein